MASSSSPAATRTSDAVPGLPRRKAGLRRRLVAVLIGLVAAVAATMGAVSTLALRGTLVDQLDTRLLASSERANAAQDAGPRPARSDSPSDREPPDNLPFALGAPGQGAGTLTLVSDGRSVLAGYLDENGAFQQLDDAQQSALVGVTADGTPRTVTLPDLGSYRIVASERLDGALLVTGLSMAEAGSTVRSYLVGEGVIALVGLAAAAAGGTALVRREMEPLERVAATAARVSEQPLERGAVTLERVPTQDTDQRTEVGQVGAALNRLLGHVEGALAARHASEMQVRQFVADASHELRTPLASIRGYAELVRRLPAGLPDDAVRAMERVESESVRMTALVEDMLLLARLDAGRNLETADVDVAALAVDAVADAHVAGRDHRWELDLAPDNTTEDDLDLAPVLVVGDEHRLHQVLVNLLSNARVHTPAGTTVVTRVRREGGTVVVQVRDDGPGIPDTMVARLFQRFARGDEARSPGTGSTGLGLAIVAAVVTAHGGTIDVDPTPGRTTFTVRLPAAAPA
jgi:two-component system OmpR family sensor kinase